MYNPQQVAAQMMKANTSTGSIKSEPDPKNEIEIKKEAPDNNNNGKPENPNNQTDNNTNMTTRNPRKKRLPLYRQLINRTNPFTDISNTMQERPLKRSRKDMITSNFQIKPLLPLMNPNLNHPVLVAGVDNQPTTMADELNDVTSMSQKNNNDNSVSSLSENRMMDSSQESIQNSSYNSKSSKTGKKNKKNADKINKIKTKDRNSKSDNYHSDRESRGNSSSRNSNESNKLLQVNNDIIKAFKYINPLGQSWMRDPADHYKQHKGQSEDSLKDKFVREGFVWKSVVLNNFANHISNKSHDGTGNNANYPTTKAEQRLEYSSAINDVRIDLDRMGQDLADIKAQKKLQFSYLSADPVNEEVIDAKLKSNLLWAVSVPYGKDPGEKAKIASFFVNLADSLHPYKKLQKRRVPFFPEILNFTSNNNNFEVDEITKSLPKTGLPEIFIRMSQYEVPFCRSIWFMKATNYGINHHQADLNPNSKNYSTHFADGRFLKLKSELSSRNAANDNACDLQRTLWTNFVLYIFEEVVNKMTNPNTPEHSTFNPSSPVQGFPDDEKGQASLNNNSQNSSDFIPKLSITKNYDPSVVPAIIGLEYYRKYWNYIVRLIAEMFNENLLDRERVIGKFIEIFDLVGQEDENMVVDFYQNNDNIQNQMDQDNNNNNNQLEISFFGVKLLLPVILNYIENILESHFLSRKLAWIVCRYLRIIYDEKREENEPYIRFNTVILGLSAIIQCIVLEIPSALVYYPEFSGIGQKDLCTNTKDNSPLHDYQNLETDSGIDNGRSIQKTQVHFRETAIQGSPLDLCPTSPSSLPFHPLIFPEHSHIISGSEVEIRNQLLKNEKHIIKRSLAVANHWSCDKWRADPNLVKALTKLVNFLGDMDHPLDLHYTGSNNDSSSNSEHSTLNPLSSNEFIKLSLQTGLIFSRWSSCYKKYEQLIDYKPNNIFIVDEIYAKIFPQNEKESESDLRNMVLQDAMVAGLCQWAICTERDGLWRATLVAKILEKRQNYVNSIINPQSQSQNQNPNQQHDNPQNQEPLESSKNYPNSFHVSVLKFMESAPILTDKNNIEELVSFQQFMLLIGELIRHDIFNYSSYLNVLMCSNDFANFQLKCEIKKFQPAKMNLMKKGSWKPVNTKKEREETSNNNFNMSLEQIVEEEPRSISQASEHSMEDINEVNPSSIMSNSNNIGSKKIPSSSSTKKMTSNSKDKTVHIKCENFDHNKNEYLWGYDQPRHLQYVMHIPLYGTSSFDWMELNTPKTPITSYSKSLRGKY